MQIRRNPIKKNYQHFCPIARALDKIGDRWTLLIVRDLLQGPRRFTDLMGSLAKITPRGLTHRLRELEASELIEKDVRKGRRESWYRLTPAGKDLLPVIDALLNWGLRHAMRPPLPGEVVQPELMVRGLTRTLNNKGVGLSRPTKWRMNFPGKAFTLNYDGEKWSGAEEEDSRADLVITTTPETWAKVSTLRRGERKDLFKTMQFEGSKEIIAEFASIFGMETGP